LILSLTHSPVAVGILALCQFMPFTLFSLVAGVVVDRLDAWKTVISTQITQMFLASTIAVIALAGVAQPWHVYVIAALMGLVQVLDAPSRQSLTFRMVGPLELNNAISLNSGVFNGARIDRKSTRLNSSHVESSYAVFCLKKKTTQCRTAPWPRCPTRPWKIRKAARRG